MVLIVFFKELIKRYKYIRRTRGDGNCFYRAFGFGYLEENLNKSKELDKFRQLTYDLKDKLVQLGYLDFTVEDVRDVVSSLLSVNLKQKEVIILARFLKSLIVREKMEMKSV